MTDRTITRQSWITAPDTARVFDAILNGGGAARFVGGCVRNALIGVPVFLVLMRRAGYVFGGSR